MPKATASLVVNVVVPLLGLLAFLNGCESFSPETSAFSSNRIRSFSHPNKSSKLLLPQRLTTTTYKARRPNDEEYYDDDDDDESGYDPKTEVQESYKN